MDGEDVNPRHLILYDGDCGFCDRAVAFVPPRDSRGAFRYASLHSQHGRRELAERGLEGVGLNSLVVLPAGASSEKRPLLKSSAVLFIVRRLDPPWSLLAGFGCIPRLLLDWGYEQIARNRHRLSNRLATCPVQVGSPKSLPNRQREAQEHLRAT